MNKVKHLSKTEGTFLMPTTGRRAVYSCVRVLTGVVDYQCHEE